MPSKYGFGNSRKKQSAMPMYGSVQKNPLKKALVGNQDNLPEELKAKIEAAPGKMKGFHKMPDGTMMADSAMKKYDSPNKQAKPDFIDIDGDGDTTESMKSAAKMYKK